MTAAKSTAHSLHSSVPEADQNVGKILVQEVTPGFFWQMTQSTLPRVNTDCSQ